MPVVSGLGFAELAAGSPVMLFWVFSELLLWARTAVLKMANAPASRMVEIFMVHSLALALIIRIMRAGSCSSWERPQTRTQTARGFGFDPSAKNAPFHEQLSIWVSSMLQCKKGTRMSATAVQPLGPPSRILMFLEGPALHEFGAFLSVIPLLNLAAKGDGHRS